MPKDFIPDFYRGLLLSEAHRDDEAVKALNLALQHDPPRAERLEIAKRLGRIHSRSGRTAEAIKVWGDVAKQFPDDRLILQELAELLAEEGQADEAIRTYRRLGELSKSDAYRKISAKIEVGQIQASQGKMKDAIATFDEALAQVDPESWLAREIRRRVEEIFVRSDDDAGLASYYRERLKQRPDDLNAMIRLAATTVKLGDREAALKQYRDAVKLAPSRRDLREAMIGELSRGGKFAEALAETQSLVEANPNDIDTLKRLGELHLKVNKDERKAMEAWKKIAAIRPNEPGLAVQAAEACRRGAGIDARTIGSAKQEEGEKKPVPETPLSRAALDLYREAVRRSPDVPQYQEYVGEYLQALGREAEARDAWRGIAAPPRDTPDNLRRLAEILAKAGMVDEAISTVDRAIKKEPDRYDLHSMAADLLARLKKYDEALAHVIAMRKLADDPYFEEQALTRRVALYGEAGRLVEEAAKLDEKLKAPGGSLDDYWLAALMANDQRRWDDAQEHLDAALKIAPFDLRLLRLKARVYASGGDLGGAAEQMKLLAQKEPKLKTNHLQDLIRVLLDMGRPADAQVAAEELVRAAPAKAESYGILADVQLRRGLVDAGLETLRRAVRIDPRDLDAHRALALALAQNQKADEAIEHQWRLFELAEDPPAKIGVAGTLADLYLAIGKFDVLAEKLRQIRRQGEDSLVPSLCLVEALRRGEDYVGARRELAELLSQEAQRPPDPRPTGGAGREPAQTWTRRSIIRGRSSRLLPKRPRWRSSRPFTPRTASPRRRRQFTSESPARRRMPTRSWVRWTRRWSTAIRSWSSPSRARSGRRGPTTGGSGFGWPRRSGWRIARPRRVRSSARFWTCRRATNTRRSPPRPGRQPDHPEHTPRIIRDSGRQPRPCSRFRTCSRIRPCGRTPGSTPREPTTRIAPGHGDGLSPRACPPREARGRLGEGAAGPVGEGLEEPAQLDPADQSLAG